MPLNTPPPSSRGWGHPGVKRIYGEDVDPRAEGHAVHVHEGGVAQRGGEQGGLAVEGRQEVGVSGGGAGRRGLCGLVRGGPDRGGEGGAGEGIPGSGRGQRRPGGPRVRPPLSSALSTTPEVTQPGGDPKSSK